MTLLARARTFWRAGSNVPFVLLSNICEAHMWSYSQLTYLVQCNIIVPEPSLNLLGFVFWALVCSHDPLGRRKSRSKFLQFCPFWAKMGAYRRDHYLDFMRTKIDPDRLCCRCKRGKTPFPSISLNNIASQRFSKTMPIRWTQRKTSNKLPYLRLKRLAFTVKTYLYLLLQDPRPTRKTFPQTKEKRSLVDIKASKRHFLTATKFANRSCCAVVLFVKEISTFLPWCIFPPRQEISSFRHPLRVIEAFTLWQAEVVTFCCCLHHKASFSSRKKEK